MGPSSYADPAIVVVTADPELLDQALSILAAVGVEATVLSDPGLLRAAWSSAGMVLVGCDQAAAVAALRLARRAEIYLLAQAEANTEAFRWSVALGAAVIVLPEGSSWLSRAVTELAGRPSGSGHAIAVVGGSGGVGVSTLAAGLAVTAARQFRRSLLIDADRLGGGLDLLIGAERMAGWRWSQLAGARGQLGNLTGQLPQLDGVDVLAMDRGGPGLKGDPGPDELRAVLQSAASSHPIVVIDLPRSAGPLVTEAAACADLVVLVVREDVRGLASGQHLLDELGPEHRAGRVVVRQSRARLMSAETVAEALGLPLLGSFVDEPALALAAERGDPPARSARSPLARLARAVLAEVLADDVAEPSQVWG
jgi:secretion/DNA translocation related CpaE-like protein